MSPQQSEGFNIKVLADRDRVPFRTKVRHIRARNIFLSEGLTHHYITQAFKIFSLMNLDILTFVIEIRSLAYGL